MPAPFARKGLEMPTHTGARLAALALVGIATHAHAQITVPTQIKFFNGTNQAESEFGWAAAIDGEHAVIGAWEFDVFPDSNRGLAFLYNVKSGARKTLYGPVGSNIKFGSKVDIEGPIVVVGSHGGAVHLFDTETGQELRVLQGVSPDSISLSTAYRCLSIDGNLVAVRGNTSNSSDHNPVLVFDAATGAQLRALRPNDTIVQGGTSRASTFGSSIDADRGQAIIGWNQDNRGLGENSVGDNIGSAYLFDLETGAQLAKFEPPAVTLDLVGSAVAIGGNTIAIGAPGNDDNGTGEGAVFVYDRESRALRYTLYRPAEPDTFEGGSGFGRSVSVAGNTVIVGAPFTDLDGVLQAGAGYIFNAATGELVTRLAQQSPQNPEELARFGFVVNATTDAMIVTAYWDGVNAGSATVFSYAQDSDLDGLWDDWEINGIPYTDSGGFEQRYILPFADPMHKDLYVEVDAMITLQMTPGATAYIEGAFALAPVSNPDGDRGIDLWVQADEADLPFIPFLPSDDGCMPDNLLDLKDTYFGTQPERADPEAFPILEAKRKAYRYSLLTNALANSKAAGCGTINGDNSVL